MQEFQLYIGGRSLPAESGATYESVNPYTGKPWALVPEASAGTSTMRWRSREPRWTASGEP